jgi:hypothetical protein
MAPLQTKPVESGVGSTITLTMDTYGHLFPGQEAETVARLPEMLGSGPEAVRATGTYDATSAAPANGAAVNRRKMIDLAGGGEKSWAGSAVQAANRDVAQVVPMSVDKKSRRVMATAGEKAEGKGIEPSTGCPAPDFEPGCQNQGKRLIRAKSQECSKM